MSNETHVVSLPSPRSQVTVYASLAVLACLLAGVMFAAGVYEQALKRGVATPVAISVPVNAGELEPSAQVEQATEYLPGQPNHVCPPCPYRHYPAVCPAPRPFTVLCYHCRTPLLVTPPPGKLGDTGQVGDVSPEPETP